MHLQRSQKLGREARQIGVLAPLSQRLSDVRLRFAADARPPQYVELQQRTDFLLEQGVQIGCGRMNCQVAT